MNKFPMSHSMLRRSIDSVLCRAWRMRLDAGVYSIAAVMAPKRTADDEHLVDLACASFHGGVRRCTMVPFADHLREVRVFCLHDDTFSINV